MADQNSFISETKPEISAKNSKSDILQAYQELLNKIQESKEESHYYMKKRKDESIIVSSAQDLSIDRIIKGLPKQNY